MNVSKCYDCALISREEPPFKKIATDSVILKCKIRESVAKKCCCSKSNYVNELSFSFGKITHGLKVLASSNSRVA